ncbi:hypothetical protein A3711_15830 [Erythrobacter sp. HI00D59]|jgi:regulator of RNase E activity RraA|nr:hypothetical protein A3711_15830 [Erythrobacter sp. HI00D59]
MTSSSAPGIKPLTGRLSGDRVHPKPSMVPDDLVARFRALDDLSSTVSDVLDELGVGAAIGAHELRPTIGDAVVIGRAVTVRNVRRNRDVYVATSEKNPLMEEIEGINQADPGDVLVIEGVEGVSNMGGMMASIAHRQQIAGVVVHGGVRDVGQARSLPLPTWSTAVTPVTGKSRCETVEVNGPIEICGVAVTAGDLVIADETGVCFVPAELCEKVVQRCEAIAERERRYLASIANGDSVPDLAKQYKPPRPISEEAGQ